MQSTNKPLQIAIDGPVAAGKGDIAARLAKELNLIYIYTGAMYRALSLACIRARVPFKAENQVVKLLETITIDLIEPSIDDTQPFKIMLNGENVTEAIFSRDVAMGTSDVSTLPIIRRIMVARQQAIAQGKRVVMEGRDIGLRVLPQADLKIFLTADVKERAHRRWLQWQEKGINKSLEETLEDTRMRDSQDMTRATDPLQKLPDAWELDSTGLTQDEVVKRIKTELKHRKLI